MRHVRSMLVVLALAHAALLVGVIAANLRPFPALRYVLHDAVLGSQFSLLGIWAGVGRSRGVVRLLLVCLLAWPVGGIWALGPMAQQLASQGFSVESLRSLMHALLLGTFVFLVQVAVVAVPLVWLRSRGRWLVDFGSQAPPPRGLAVQFSIRHVLVATVGLALLLAAGQSVRLVGNMGEDGSVSTPHSWFGAVLPIVFLVAILVYIIGIPVTALWACLGRERPAPRLLLVLLLVLAAAACPVHVFGGIRHLEFALVIIVQFGILTASLLVFRRLGYRWITAEALWECALSSADFGLPRPDERGAKRGRTHGS